MALSQNINDLEKAKFLETGAGATAVRVSGDNFSGSFTVSGLSIGGRVTIVTLNSSTWTALPSSPLSNRNAIAIQNEHASIKVKINYSDSVSGFVGTTIFPNGGERQYNIADGIILYAKCESGTIDVTVEELS